MLPKLLIFTTSFSLKVEYDFVIIVLRSFLFIKSEQNRFRISQAKSL